MHHWIRLPYFLLWTSPGHLRCPGCFRPTNIQGPTGWYYHRSQLLPLGCRPDHSSFACFLHRPEGKAKYAWLLRNQVSSGDYKHEPAWKLHFLHRVQTGHPRKHWIQSPWWSRAALHRYKTRDRRVHQKFHSHTWGFHLPIFWRILPYSVR